MKKIILKKCEQAGIFLFFYEDNEKNYIFFFIFDTHSDPENLKFL